MSEVEGKFGRASSRCRHESKLKRGTKETETPQGWYAYQATFSHGKPLYGNSEASLTCIKSEGSSAAAAKLIFHLQYCHDILHKRCQNMAKVALATSEKGRVCQVVRISAEQRLAIVLLQTMLYHL